MKKEIDVIRSAALSLFFLAFTCLACNKMDLKETPSVVSLYQITIDDDVTFGMLRSAIGRAGLSEKFHKEGPFNLFAPTNAAFKAAGYNDTLAIRAADPDRLAAILNYHLSKTNIDLNAMPPGFSEIPSESGQNLILYKDSQGKLSINGADITGYNYKATNGLLHVVNRLLIPPAGNISETVNANSSLTFLAAAITRASTGSTNIAQILAGPDITLFAPTNAAFTSAGYSSINAINAADPNTLADILMYHILQGKKFTAQFKDTTVLSLNQKTLYLSKPSVGTSLINGLALSGINANVIASNGVVHIVSKVLVAPSKNLVQVVESTSNLTFLKAALNRTVGSANNLVQLLSGTTPYTLLAPNDNAFKAAGYADLAAVNNASPETLAALLMLHIVKNRRFSLSFTVEVSTIQALSGDNITVSTTSGFKVGGAGNASLATCSPADVLATNGVIHIINQTLKP